MIVSHRVNKAQRTSARVHPVSSPPLAKQRTQSPPIEWALRRALEPRAAMAEAAVCSGASATPRHRRQTRDRNASAKKTAGRTTNASMATSAPVATGTYQLRLS